MCATLWFFPVDIYVCVIRAQTLSDIKQIIVQYVGRRLGLCYKLGLYKSPAIQVWHQSVNLM